MTASWTLDTCGFDLTTENCVIEVDNNFEFIRFLRRCPAHSTATIAENTTGFTQIRAENSRGPSNALWELLQAAPTGAVDISANGNRSFKNNITVNWNWSGTAPNRLLTINVLGASLTANQQNNIRNAVNNRFGTGLVTINFA